MITDDRTLLPPPNFTFAHYRFTIQALEPLHLPPFKGSALRGGFGHTFKRLACAEPWPCDDHCQRGNACPYGYIFETAPPQDSQVLRTHQAIPRPFVIRHPLDQRTLIPAREQLEFGLVLVGRATEFWPHFVLTFQELGKVGLGHKRGKYTLREVQAVRPSGEKRTVYDGETLLNMNTDLEITADQIHASAEQPPADRLTVHLLTPTRLKHNKKFILKAPPFHVLFRTLLRRLSSLSYFHCGRQWDINYRGWIERAEKIQIVEHHTAWQDWGRRSGRQHQRIDMGGLVGDVTYSGDLAPFRPLLALGQWTHVGKGAVFGNGQYTLDGG